MTPEKLGSVIGAVFGLVFVWANTGSLPTGPATVLRGLGTAAFLGAGLAVLNGPLDAPQAGVAWVCLVVGAHFTAPASLWKQPLFHWLGAALAVCGVLGLVLAATGAGVRWIDLAGGWRREPCCSAPPSEAAPAPARSPARAGAAAGRSTGPRPGRRGPDRLRW